jgi:hypothetical protein
MSHAEFFLDQPLPRPVPATDLLDRRLPYRIAVPVVATLSLTLWLLIWQTARFALHLLAG